MKSSSAALAAIALALLAFTSAPAIRADIPADQVKAAGAIPLTTELLDKMDKFIKAMTANNAAKAELTAIGNDPSVNPDTWASVVAAKCPKTVEVFKASAVTADEFSKAIFAIMAVSFSDDFLKSEDKAAKANAEFVAANKDRASTIFGAFLALSMPPDPSSSSAPVSTP